MATDKNMQIRHFNGSEWEDLKPKTTIPQVEGLSDELSTIDAIARGASRASVFADVAALETWLAVSGNTDLLEVGDNLYILEVTEPDFWWTGTGIAPLGAEAVNLELASSAGDGLMSKEDFDKLNGIAAGANNYTHPSTDGNLHVPATGTTSDGKVLVAGDSAGSAEWLSLSDAGIAAEEHTHSGDYLSISSFTVGLTPPASPKNGDIFFDYNN